MGDTDQPEVKQTDNVDAGAAPQKVASPLERNNRIAAGIYTLFQIASIVLFAIFVRPQPVKTVIDNGLFEAVGVALLVLVGKIVFMQVSAFTFHTSGICSGRD
jgi:hypothetical protein